MSALSREAAVAVLDEHEWTWAKRDHDGDGVLLGCSGCDWTHEPSGATGLGWAPHHRHLADLLVPDEAAHAEKDAIITALVRALTKAHGNGKKKPLPTIPIGTRVRVHDSGASGIGTVVGRDGYSFDGVAIIFDKPAPRGFEDGCCAGVEQCEILAGGA